MPERRHIFKIGKAGNPQITDGVDIVIGASTEIIAGERKILTAGGIDTHIHFISPEQVPAALCNGITTMVGGGTGPAEGTKATTITPGACTSPGCCRRPRGGCPLILACSGRATRPPSSPSQSRSAPVPSD